MLGVDFRRASQFETADVALTTSACRPCHSSQSAIAARRSVFGRIFCRVSQAPAEASCNIGTAACVLVYPYLTTASGGTEHHIQVIGDCHEHSAFALLPCCSVWLEPIGVCRAGASRPATANTLADRPRRADYGLPKFGFSSSTIHGFGERVESVRWGGRAARLGLEPGDVILSLNGYRLTYRGSWNDALSRCLVQRRLRAADEFATFAPATSLSARRLSTTAATARSSTTTSDQLLGHGPHPNMKHGRPNQDRSEHQQADDYNNRRRDDRQNDGRPAVDRTQRQPVGNDVRQLTDRTRLRKTTARSCGF